MTTLHVPMDVKGLRETLLEAKSHIDGWMPSDYLEHSARLQLLLNECDRLRPLGPDGKHGDRHTPHCGCTDKGHGWWCDHMDCHGCSFAAPAGAQCPMCYHNWRNISDRKAKW